MRTLRVNASILWLVAAAVQVVAAPRPITHEDVWLMKQVGAPVPSPDGKWVVVSVTEPAYDETKQVSDLWIVPADGSARPRRLTNSRTAESGVQWSPDSRRIAFSTRREGDDVNQIYVMDIAGGGEAQRITSLSTGATTPTWRPDGGAIAFTSMVYPGAMDDDANKKNAAERKADKAHVRVYETFPIRHWDHWLDDRQVHLFVQELSEGSKARDVLAGSKLVSGRGYSGTETNAGEELVSAWAPDGQSLVFAATANRTEAAYARTIMRMYQVPAAGGEPKQITPTGNAASFTKPAFSPDGKGLFALREQEGDQSYYAARIARMAWPSTGQKEGEWQTVTASSDLSATSYAFAPDSRTVYFLAENNGLEKVLQAPATSGDVRESFAADLGCYTNLAIPSKAASPMLFADWGSAANPAEVVRVDAGGHRQRLTNFNVERAAQLDLPPLRHFWITSTRGKRIHSMLVLPPDFDESKKYPLLVLIHGGAANMWRDEFGVRWNYHMHSAPGYVVVLTNYTGSTGSGEKFAQEIRFDPLKGPGDEINEAADAAIKQFPFIDGSRQAAAGASYGGHLINWMQASTSRYKALVAHAGLINLESQWGTSDGIYHRELEEGGPYWEKPQQWQEQNPIRFAKNFHTPILLSVGEHDFRVPMNETLENWSILQRLRVPSKLLIWEDENHWISKGEDSRRFYQEVRDWLAKYL
jgi:dipeptidyl aminopeptidase/acylaminoacyl peptidase